MQPLIVFLSIITMKALPTVRGVKMRHSEKSFVPEQKRFDTKELSLFKVISLIPNLVAMTTVKISFVDFFSEYPL